MHNASTCVYFFQMFPSHIVVATHVRKYFWEIDHATLAECCHPLERFMTVDPTIETRRDVEGGVKVA